MMKITPYLILLSFVAVLIISVIYISRRFAWAFELERTYPLYIAFTLIPLFSMIAGIAFINTTDPLGHILNKIAFISMGVYLFIIMSLIFVDTLGLFAIFRPAVFGLTVLSIAAIVSLYSYWNASNITNTRIDIPIKGLKNEVKAVHLSDIHIGHFRTQGYLNDIIEKTNSEEPDIIFITGDYLDSKYALREKYFKPLRKLSAPVYFVDGNHDLATNNDSIVYLMKKAGVNVLQSEVVNWGELQIVGLNHMAADRNTFDVHTSGLSKTIEETLPKLNIKKDKPSIVLHHAPNGVKYANKEGVDLYLAGHTHAGQIFPFNIFSNMMFDYNRGLHKYKETKIFISEGIGTFGPPFRLGTKSEIISFRLIPN